jgi:5-methylcytosine-specific restriction endonuclease McrA
VLDVWDITKVYKPAFGWVDDIPPAVRSAVRLRAHGRCEKCGAKARLEIHHLTYDYSPSELIFGREMPDDLQALCRRCHHQAHIDPAGDFWLDPQEMKNYWRQLTPTF